jgi:hypothetical protein
MFADIDGESLSATPLQIITLFNRLMKHVFKLLKMKYNSKHVRILSACDGSKTSFHWSYFNGCTFANSEEQKKFWQYVSHIIESNNEYNDLTYLNQRSDNKCHSACIIDMSVYSNNRAMRTILSHKENSDRTLMPVTATLKSKRKYDINEYLIFSPESDTHYELTIPDIDIRTAKTTYLTRDEVKDIILRNIPNVKIVEFKGRLIKLANDGVRCCLINAEENTSDNSYVIWKRTGLYHGCHNAECEGKSFCIYNSNSKLQEEIKKIEETVVPLNYFDLTDSYTYKKFHSEYNQRHFTSFDEMKIELLKTYHKAINKVLIGQGLYLKKMKDSIDITRKLGSSSFEMTYDYKQQDGRTSVKTISIDRFLNKLNAYENIQCKLDTKNADPDSFNLFTGFQAMRVDLNKISDTSKAKKGLELMKSFLFESWCNSNQVTYNYIISWFAGLVTNLTGINRVALAMVSEQGTGKGFFLEFMKMILRRTNVAETQGIQSISQKHNTIIQNKRLVVINEMSSTRDEFKSNFDKIKTYITDPVIQIEPKGVDPYSIDNIANFILFTNHRDSIIIEDSDRRYAVFEMSSVHRNDVDYFSMLHDACFNQETANAFYTYLLEFKSDNIHKIPESKLKNEMKDISKPSALKFIDAILIKEDSSSILEYSDFTNATSISATVLYNKYSEWCRTNGERAVSSTKFGISAKQKIESKHTKKGRVYIINRPSIDSDDTGSDDSDSDEKSL